MLRPDLILLPSPGPDTPAIIVPPAPGTATGTVQLSYRRLDGLVLHAQESLARLGIAAGSRVAVALPNGPEFVVVFLALARQRAVVVPLNPDAKEAEQKQMLRRLQPRCAIVPDDEFRRPMTDASTALGIPVILCTWGDDVQQVLLRHDAQGHTPISSAAVVTPEEVRPDDVVLLHYTSGTTGLPKAVGLTHAGILASVRILVEAHSLLPTDRAMIVAPFFHVGGTCSSLLCALAAGGCAIIPRSLSGNFWHQFRDLGATWYHAVPTMHRLLLSFPRPVEGLSIRFARSGGSSMSAVLMTELERTLNCPVLEGYGMTETVQAVFCNRLDGSSRLPGHFPVPDELEVKIRVPDGNESFQLTSVPGCTGEVCVRGPCVISGYLDDPETNANSFHENFFRTGDLGSLRADGRLHITGRTKDMINKGGEKISPLDIEHIVLAHEGVQEVACFKVADDTYGEDIGKWLSCFEVSCRPAVEQC